MDKKKKIITLIVAMAMFCMMSMSALADVDVVVSLPKDQVWTSGYSVSRKAEDSSVYACCQSVYPTNGAIDTYKRIQARVVNSSGTLIMTTNKVVLEEGGGYQLLDIKDIYSHLETVYIQFRGNSNAAAEAVVAYFSL